MHNPPLQIASIQLVVWLLLAATITITIVNCQSNQKANSAPSANYDYYYGDPHDAANGGGGGNMDAGSGYYYDDKWDYPEDSAAAAAAAAASDPNSKQPNQAPKDNKQTNLFNGGGGGNGENSNNNNNDNNNGGGANIIGGYSSGSTHAPSFNNNQNNVLDEGNGNDDAIDYAYDGDYEDDDLNGDGDLDLMDPMENDNDVLLEEDEEEHITFQSSRSKLLAIITKPGILAGIVGGAIIGILTAILLIMFIVYRMRKKDEGSYALEEPKKPLNAYDYRHCPTKEFYA